MFGRLARMSAVGLGGGGVFLGLGHATGKWDLKNIGPVRFGRAARTVGRVVLDYKLSLRGIAADTKEYKEAMSKCHLRSAERLRAMCCVNGGCFIKVGQHIGALDYLLPKEYVDTMKVLHSGAPQSPVSSLYQVIEEDLHCKVEDVFEDFEDHPLGAASLAQVHRARLKGTNTVVAVKVQHPNVMAHSFVDMATMELLIRLVAFVFPNFQFMWLADETRKNLPLELDFIHEGENCETVDKMLSGFSFLKVPRIYWDYSTKRVLTMEYCEGGQVNDKAYIHKHNISTKEISEKLSAMYSEMIFVHGYIHCDPHPGNILVKQTKEQGLQIVLLDHGLYQSLTDEFRISYGKLWMGLIRGDVEKIKKYGQRLGAGELFPLFACMVTARSWDSVAKGIDKKHVTKEEMAAPQDNVNKQSNNDDDDDDDDGMLDKVSEVLQSLPHIMHDVIKYNFLIHGSLQDKQGRGFEKFSCYDDGQDDDDDIFDVDESRIIGYMGRVAVHTVYAYKRWKCGQLPSSSLRNSIIVLRCRLRRSISEAWYLCLVRVVQLYFWAQDTWLGQRVERVWDGIVDEVREHTGWYEDRDKLLRYTHRILTATHNFQGDFSGQM